jgi:hypothetical protein
MGTKRFCVVVCLFCFTLAAPRASWAQGTSAQGAESFHEGIDLGLKFIIGGGFVVRTGWWR